MDLVIQCHCQQHIAPWHTRWKKTISESSSTFFDNGRWRHLGNRNELMQQGRFSKTNKYSFVYFITDGHGHIKIGKADDTYKRIKELQTGNPYKLSFLLTVMLESPDDAFALEQKLHARFAQYQMEGEWFEAEPVMELIDSETIQMGKFTFGGLRYGRSVK